MRNDEGAQRNAMRTPAQIVDVRKSGAMMKHGRVGRRMQWRFRMGGAQQNGMEDDEPASGAAIGCGDRRRRYRSRFGWVRMMMMSPFEFLLPLDISRI